MSTLNFNLAIVNHRNWMIQLRPYIKSGTSNIPEEKFKSHHACNLGQWIEGEAENECKDLKELGDLKNNHQQLHELTNEIISLHNSDNKEEAIKKFEELEQISEKIADLLTQMKDEVE